MYYFFSNKKQLKLIPAALENPSPREKQKMKSEAPNQVGRSRNSSVGVGFVIILYEFSKEKIILVFIVQHYFEY